MWTVYQFHGCYWHGHDCDLCKEGSVRGLSPPECLADTKRKEDYLKALGYRLVTI